MRTFKELGQCSPQFYNIFTNFMSFHRPFQNIFHRSGFLQIVRESYEITHNLRDWKLASLRDLPEPVTVGGSWPITPPTTPPEAWRAPDPLPRPLHPASVGGAYPNTSPTGPLTTTHSHFLFPYFKRIFYSFSWKLSGQDIPVFLFSFPWTSLDFFWK